MLSNLYKLSPNQRTSVKKWARTVRNNDALGTLSKIEMTQVHSLVRRHLRVLMCRETESSLIPPSLSTIEISGLINRFPVGAELPQGYSAPFISATDFVKTGVHMTPDDFSEVEMEFKRWGLRRFSFNWATDLEDHVNTLARELFWTTFHRAIRVRSYHFTINSNLLSREIVLPVFLSQFKRLAQMYQEQCQNPEILDYHYMVVQKKKLCKEYADYLVKTGADPALASIFQPRNHAMMGNVYKVKVMAGTQSINELHLAIPQWWSRKMTSFMEVIEERVNFHATSREVFPRNARPACKFIVANFPTNDGFIPRHLPADLYSDHFKSSLQPADVSDLKMKPAVLPDLDNMTAIFTPLAHAFDYHPLDGVVDERYSSDEDLSSDGISESDSEIVLSTSASDQAEGNDVENSVQKQISTLHADLQQSITILTDFQKELQQLLPMRLEELKKAKDDINLLNTKLNSLQGGLGAGQIPPSTAEVGQDTLAVESNN